METTAEETKPLVSQSDEYKDMDRRLIPEYERQKGTKLVQDEKYSDAIKAYSKAVMAFQFLVKDNQLQKQHIRDMLKQTVLPCYSNITLCYLKKEEWENVVTFATRVIENDRQNTKAHYRRGTAYKKLKKYDEGIRDLERAKLLDNSLTDSINNVLREIAVLKKNQKVKEKKIAEKLLMGYGEAIQQQQKIQEERRIAESVWGKIKTSISNAFGSVRRLLCPRREQKAQ